MPWLWRRSRDWKGFQSDWLSLCSVQGGELVQLAVDLKAPKHKLVPWLWRRSWDWKGLKSDWLSLCPVQGGELVQLAGDLKVPGSSPGLDNLQL